MHCNLQKMWMSRIQKVIEAARATADGTVRTALRVSFAHLDPIFFVLSLGVVAAQSAGKSFSCICSTETSAGTVALIAENSVRADGWRPKLTNFSRMAKGSDSAA